MGRLGGPALLAAAVGLVAGVALVHDVGAPRATQPVGAPSLIAVTQPRPASGDLIGGERLGDTVLVRLRTTDGVHTLTLAPDAVVTPGGGLAASSVQGLLAFLRGDGAVGVRLGYDAAGRVSSVSAA